MPITGDFYDSKRYQLERQCKGKINYGSEQNAVRAAIRMSEREQWPYTWYCCQNCTGWHIAHEREQNIMADKVKRLNLQRDYKKFLYYIDSEGQVCAKPKAGKGDAIVLDSGIKREPGFLYYIDKDGDIARSAMARRKKPA